MIECVVEKRCTLTVEPGSVVFITEQQYQLAKSCLVVTEADDTVNAGAPKKTNAKLLKK